MTRHVYASALFGGLVAAFLAAGGCSSGGGPVPTNSPDQHCKGMPAQPTSQSVCHEMAMGGAGGMADADSEPDYGPTMDGSEGDDDDCKYHVSWTATSIEKNKDITFTVTATNKTDNSPVTDASTLIEAFLSDTHPAPNTKVKTVESPKGTYKIGPIRFDASGKWTVRYHFFEECSDLDDKSPHGHAAFYVEVP